MVKINFILRDHIQDASNVGKYEVFIWHSFKVLYSEVFVCFAHNAWTHVRRVREATRLLVFTYLTS